MVTYIHKRSIKVNKQDIQWDIPTVEDFIKEIHNSFAFESDCPNNPYSKMRD